MSTRNVEPKLDLVPIMNLVTILIPFLLLSAEFVSLSVVDVTVRGARPAIDESVDPPTFALTVAVSDQALTILSTDGALNALGETSMRIPCDGLCEVSGYPLERLQDALYDAKQLHPDVSAMTLTAGDRIETETLVNVMDAARSHPGHVRDGRASELYPAVTLASQ